MSLTSQRERLESTEPWSSDPPRMRTYMAAALHYEDIGQNEKAEQYLEKAIAEETKFLAQAE